MTQFIDTLVGIFQSSGFAQLWPGPGGWLYAVMICVGCFLLYLAIVKEFETPDPAAHGLWHDPCQPPGSGIIHMQYFVGDGLEHPMWVEILNNGGLADMLYMGVKLGIYPPLIFLGIGTMTDFAPLISKPQEPAAGRCRTVRYLRYLHGRPSAGRYRSGGLHPEAVRCHLHHRRCRRPHRYLRYLPSGT